MATKAAAKRTPAKKTVARVARPTTALSKPARSTVGQRIIEGLEQAVVWTQRRTEGAQVTVVHVPQTDVREVRQQMGLSQSQFAAKFGFPLATSRAGNRAAPGPTHPRACCWPSSRGISRQSRMSSARRAEAKADDGGSQADPIPRMVRADSPAFAIDRRSTSDAARTTLGTGDSASDPST